MEAIQKTNKRENVTFLFQRFIILMFAFMVSSAFVACNDKNPDDDPVVTGDDAVSVNALVGSWRVSINGFYIYWDFGKDGSFAYYVANQRSVSANYESFTKGKFRVKGSVIELYNCQNDSESTGYSYKYFGDSRSSIPANTLLNTPLKDAKKSNDFSMVFEFIDVMRLRIIIDLGNPIDKYDTRFTYREDKHNVTIPSHSLPGLAWPKNDIPSGVPEYSDGRIWKVETVSGSIRIEIDRTTHADLLKYVNGLLQAGWKDYNGYENVSEWLIEGKYSYSTFEKTDYHYLGITINEYGDVTLVY